MAGCQNQWHPYLLNWAHLLYLYLVYGDIKHGQKSSGFSRFYSTLRSWWCERVWITSATRLSLWAKSKSSPLLFLNVPHQCSSGNLQAGYIQVMLCVNYRIKNIKRPVLRVVECNHGSAWWLNSVELLRPSRGPNCAQERRVHANIKSMVHLPFTSVKALNYIS